MINNSTTRSCIVALVRHLLQQLPALASASASPLLQSVVHWTAGGSLSEQ